MVKGLEFDEVIAPVVNKSNYHTEIDRSTFYIALTRAVHWLRLICEEAISGLLV
ncbi:ATP-binding domain-containing protein [uncultured Dysgonomonas sp.]|uniref:ATP-binding domain-containing protein n=1 Tax=uncultured Dysgonomonas sp. TaxID=206096 RepID=UPI0028041AAA|nr:ATP-binding domain-containing protein [uncultured Dysgonomonas sp.]